jgi:hypothetical protein
MMFSNNEPSAAVVFEDEVVVFQATIEEELESDELTLRNYRKAAKMAQLEMVRVVFLVPKTFPFSSSNSVVCKWLDGRSWGVAVRVAELRP